MNDFQQNINGSQEPTHQSNKIRQLKENEWQGIGIIRPRSANENDPIKFYPFNKKEGGGINFNLKIQENIGVDENGNPRIFNISVPISVMTNKLITAQQLQSVQTGMKARVVGKIGIQTYTPKNSDKPVSQLFVQAYIFEILDNNINIGQNYQQTIYNQPPQYYNQGYNQPPQLYNQQQYYYNQRYNQIPPQQYYNQPPQYYNQPPQYYNQGYNQSLQQQYNNQNYNQTQKNQNIENILKDEEDLPE